MWCTIKVGHYYSETNVQYFTSGRSILYGSILYPLAFAKSAEFFFCGKKKVRSSYLHENNVLCVQSTLGPAYHEYFNSLKSAHYKQYSL